MPRDSGGTYTLPAGNPVVTNTPITIAWANGTLNDITTAMTDSLSRTGQGGMTNPLQLPNGAVALPALTFSTETSLGFYRNASGTMSFATGSAKVVEFSAVGLGTIAGSAAAPSHTFHADPNTGMSAAVADTLVFSTAGVQRASFAAAAASIAATAIGLTGVLTQTGAASFTSTMSVGGVLTGLPGTAALPGYTFTGDPNTGMSAQTADTLILSTAGAARLTVSAASATLAATAIALTGSTTQTGAFAVVGAATVSTTLGVTGVLSALSTLELGNASDTTISRVSAGIIAVEGDNVVVVTAGGASNPTNTLESGTYTPTFLAGTRTSAATPRVCRYIRVGNQVMVFGTADITTSGGAGAADFTLTVPITMNTTTFQELAGTSTWNAAAGRAPGRIAGDPTAETANFQFTSSANESATMDFSFAYTC